MDSTVAMTCTSLRNPLGKSGRIGRSIRREAWTAASPGRPSRLKKPPGIFPAAYILSSKSQVSGKKSMPSRGWAEVAVARTMVPALADHLQQPPPGVHVLLVRGEVLGELSDALREQRNLDFRRAGIPVVPLKLAHDLSFHILCQRHTLYPHLTVTHKNRIAEGPPEARTSQLSTPSLPC